MGDEKQRASDEREPTIDEVRAMLRACEANGDSATLRAFAAPLRALLRRMEEDAESVALVDMLRTWVPEANEWLARRKR